MSLIRSLLPEAVNKPVWYVFGRVLSNLKYYYNTTFSADEVFPNIYIGDLSSSLNQSELKKHGITTILSVYNGSYDVYPKDFNYKIVNINDDNWVNIYEHFNDCVKFIDDAVQKDEKVLVHCQRGVSRSVSMVIAYLISKQNYTYDTALEKIRETRAIANPNGGFKEQLIRYRKEMVEETKDEK
jgi:protein-tyrosine phosphatase